MADSDCSGLRLQTTKGSHMFRFSLATFLLVVALVSAVFAGLAFPNAYWKQIVATITLGMLIVAFLAAIAWQRSGKWFWFGFAAVGWGYLALLFYGGDEAKNVLLTHSAVVQLDRMLETSTPTPSPNGAAIWQNTERGTLYQQRGSVFSGLSLEEAKQQDLLKHAYTQHTLPRSSHFHDIGHYAWSLLLGCIGGLLSLSLHRKSAATASP